MQPSWRIGYRRNRVVAGDGYSTPSSGASDVRGVVSIKLLHDEKIDAKIPLRLFASLAPF